LSIVPSQKLLIPVQKLLFFKLNAECSTLNAEPGNQFYILSREIALSLYRKKLLAEGNEMKNEK
jgi:hypothetical protein